jgi:hypothetical protein
LSWIFLYPDENGSTHGQISKSFVGYGASLGSKHPVGKGIRLFKPDQAGTQAHIPELVDLFPAEYV